MTIDGSDSLVLGEKKSDLLSWESSVSLVITTARISSYPQTQSSNQI